MDQVTIVDNQYLTREFLETQLVANRERIQQLEEHIQKLTQRSYSDSADKNRMVEAMQEWTLEALDEDSITIAQAEEIASICGFDLTKEFEVEVTVTYNMTVNAKNEQEADSIVNDIDFDTISYDDESISYLSSSVDSVNI